MSLLAGRMSFIGHIISLACTLCVCYSGTAWGRKDIIAKKDTTRQRPWWPVVLCAGAGNILPPRADPRCQVPVPPLLVLHFRWIHWKLMSHSSALARSRQELQRYSSAVWEGTMGHTYMQYSSCNAVLLYTQAQWCGLLSRTHTPWHICCIGYGWTVVPSSTIFPPMVCPW